jgi:hypothetical protein
MNITKLLSIENDGLNMAAEGQFLYLRCMRAMYKYDLTDMRLTAQNSIFKKDGKARNFSICGAFIFLTDFCDLYILEKENLRIIRVIRLGEDLSSDLGTVRFGHGKAYICIRNGKMAVMDIMEMAAGTTETARTIKIDEAAGTTETARTTEIDEAA